MKTYKVIKINAGELQPDWIVKYEGLPFKVSRIDTMGAFIVPFTRTLRKKIFSSIEEELAYHSKMSGSAIISATAELPVFGKHLSNIKKAKRIQK